jgi:hypothetical protein
MIRPFAGLALLVFTFAGCRITPDEVQKIRIENELLREQIQIVRQNCSYYRDLEVEVEKEAPPDR